jgi:CelD/BcsL family acetyltransferase involved in cellulose biosynthesis
VFLGSGTAAPDHLDLIVRRGWEPIVGPALWAALSRDRSWHLADLDGVREGSILARVALRRSADLADLAESTPCPFLPLPPTWEEYERVLGKNTRQNLRRYARKMEREAAAPVTERLVVGPEDVRETIDALGVMHQTIRTAAGDAGAFANGRLRSFHQLAASNFARAGRLRLHRLDVGGSPVAAIYCFRYGDVVSFYSTGYDREYSRYGPGRRIMATAIAAAIDEGAKEFDFLRGDEEYKNRWGTEMRHDLRIILPTSPRGRLIRLLRRAAVSVRRSASRARSRRAT